MKIIQWYPGHMAKAMRMMEENLKLCDALIYVLDARAPVSTFNRRIADMAGTKPVLYVLNKGDLADAKADAFSSVIRGQGGHAVRISANGKSALRTLQSAMQTAVAQKTEKLREKGTTRPVRFLVAGVPNTGKSTVINLLCGARRAVTGDKAGVTRAKQWVKCGNFELLDTPGTMPPSFDNQTLARRLAYIGSVNDDILEMDEIALALLEELSRGYPERLAERYGIAPGLEPLEMLNKVCARRGFVLKGNDYDYERGERALVDDFRKGKLGAVTLDRPEDAECVVYHKTDRA